MYKITFLEFIIRGIPEGFMFFLAAYAFSKNKIELKKYILSSLLFSGIVYLMRFLPVQYEALTILNLIVLIGLAAIINKINVIKAIKAGIIIMILGFICEGLNIFIIQFVLQKDLNIIFSNNTLKVLYGIPSSVIFACIVSTYYLRLKKRKELQHVSTRKISQ
jgi:hypothetical protein